MADINKIAVFTTKLCTIFYYCGLPNLWANGISTTIYYIHFHKFITIILCLFIFSEWMAFGTQKNLSEKQASDRLVFCISHSLLMSYYFNIVYYKNKITNLLHKLCITLKKDYNDPHIEKATIKGCIFYSVAFSSTIAFGLSAFAFDSILQVIRSEGTFTTVVTAWPEVTDTSVKANILRVISYLVWWVLMARVSAAYVAVMCITIKVSHQYKNLQSYFYSLNDLFEDSDNLKPQDQERRERLYEKGIKIGIKLHAETLWCIKEYQLTCSTVFSGHILHTVGILCILMLQMVSSERTQMNAVALVTSSVAVLSSIGFLMCNAGDITVEAALLPTAMFHSGWHNCRGTSAPRIKKMLVLAMRQSQKPVVIRSFGIVEISYQSYLSIVKSSYSVFSLLY